MLPMPDPKRPAITFFTKEKSNNQASAPMSVNTISSAVKGALGDTRHGHTTLQLQFSKYRQRDSTSVAPPYSLPRYSNRQKNGQGCNAFALDASALARSSVTPSR
jgi:hypothetical protein